MSHNGSPQKRANIDPASQQLGAIYAQALLGAAENSGATDAVLAELDSFVVDVLDPHPKFEAVLGSAIISAEEKQQILDRTIGNQASPLLANFLKVLAKHGRLGALRAVHRVAHDLYNQLRGRVRVEVTTAAAVDGALAEQLSGRVRQLLGREPVLDISVDPSLIGGIVLRVGDTVYDGSIATQLNRISGQIISRSVHEIQSRRDRFSYSAGN